MAFMNTLLSAEMTNLIGKFLLVLYNAIGDFGWTVVVFTLLLKTVVLPLDIWQKFSMRKQSKAMERIRPQLEKLQKQYANRPDILRQKQAELQKKEKIHVFCVVSSYDYNDRHILGCLGRIQSSRRIRERNHS